MVATSRIQNKTDLRLLSIAANIYRVDMGGAVLPSFVARRSHTSPTVSDAQLTALRLTPPRTAEPTVLAELREEFQRGRASSVKTVTPRRVKP